jgi:carboxyl-terminal processing protease
VWKTVNERFYDPTFGGVDWQKVHERYLPLVAAAKSDREVHLLLQQMIGELHQSHFVIVPKEAIPKLLPKHKEDDDEGGVGDKDDTEDLMAAENDETATPLDRLGYKMTERLTTGIGIDLRVIKGAAVITRVEPVSVAARAGLRPGFIIKHAGGRSLETAIAQFESNPTFQSVFRGEMPEILLAAFINGERQSPLRIGFVNGRNQLRTISIKREKLKGEMSPAIGNLPAMYTEFESKRLPGGFGYIRFNAFVPVEMKKVCAALRSMHDVRGLIFDLRGNQGGLLGMIGGLSGLLETKPVALGRMQTRTGRTSILAFPQRAPYSGPIVIVVDGSTQSAAEMFASGLQEIGRAVIVGEKSAGNTLPSTIMKLPTGALFQFAFANYQTLAGNTVEGQGITPDVSVGLTRRSLLLGADPQMTAATRKIRELAYRVRQRPATGSPKELAADLSATTVAKPDNSGKVIVTVAEPPPPQAKASAAPVGRVEEKKEPGIAGMPSVDQIIDRYIEALGGRKALEKLTSRVSKGTIELQSMGLTGTTEVYEQAPNKSSTIINVEGLGTIQQTFDGTRSWMQHPLEGYVAFPRVRSEADFHRELHFKELHPGLVLAGKETVGERETFVLRSYSNLGLEKWYFDVQDGLLLRQGNTYFEDYRNVDGVKIAFKVSDNASYGFGVVVRLTEIKHNVPIDAAKFAEAPDCFTRPDENWLGRK